MQTRTFRTENWRLHGTYFARQHSDKRSFVQEEAGPPPHRPLPFCRVFSCWTNVRGSRGGKVARRLPGLDKDLARAWAVTLTSAAATPTAQDRAMACGDLTNARDAMGCSAALRLPQERRAVPLQRLPVPVRDPRFLRCWRGVD